MFKLTLKAQDPFFIYLIFLGKILWLDSFWSRFHKSHRLLFILSYFIQFCHVSNSIWDYRIFAIASCLISWTCFFPFERENKIRNTKKKTSNILGIKCNFRSFLSCAKNFSQQYNIEIEISNLVCIWKGY